jgi:hypothetical protein
MTTSDRPVSKTTRQKFFVALGAAAIAAGSHYVDGAASALMLSLATYIGGWLTRWPGEPKGDRSSSTSIPPPPAERAAEARARHDGGKSSGGNPFGH